MLLKTVRSVNLLLAGTLTGNELGTWAAVHPAVEELSPAERLRAEQALTRRFGAIMPAWMGAALASSAAAPLLSRGSAGFRSPLFGALCFAAMLASTRLGNVPINDRTLELTEDDLEEFGRLRDRRGRLHPPRGGGATVGGGGRPGGGGPAAGPVGPAAHAAGCAHRGGPRVPGLRRAGGR